MEKSSRERQSLYAVKLAREQPTAELGRQKRPEIDEDSSPIGVPKPMVDAFLNTQRNADESQESEASAEIAIVPEPKMKAPRPRLDVSSEFADEDSDPRINFVRFQQDEMNSSQSDYSLQAEELEAGRRAAVSPKASLEKDFTGTTTVSNGLKSDTDQKLPKPDSHSQDDASEK